MLHYQTENLTDTAKRAEEGACVKLHKAFSSDEFLSVYGTVSYMCCWTVLVICQRSQREMIHTCTSQPQIAQSTFFISTVKSLFNLASLRCNNLFFEFFRTISIRC